MCIRDREDLLKHYFESHDPTQVNRQGNDIGTQYRSTVLYLNDNQQEITQSIASEFQELLINANYGEIKTIIKKLDKFYKAEEYHQDFEKLMRCY